MLAFYLAAAVRQLWRVVLVYVMVFCSFLCLPSSLESSWRSYSGNEESSITKEAKDSAVIALLDLSIESVISASNSHWLVLGMPSLLCVSFIAGIKVSLPLARPVCCIFSLHKHVLSIAMFDCTGRLRIKNSGLLRAVLVRMMGDL